MKQALIKEWTTWTKYSAVDIIPESKTKHIDPSLILDSKVVWTDKAVKPGEFEPKCRITGKGFQQVYDDKLRRDSPTVTPQMMHMMCSLASSLKLKLHGADVTGAFLQGKKIQRELYFRLPRNLGPLTIPGVKAGDLLRLNKSIYGLNDAARAWYLALCDVLESQGWTKLTFEPGSFVHRDAKGKIDGLLCMHVDDLLICTNDQTLLDRMRAAIDFGSFRSGSDGFSFCGREFRQAEDYSVRITMEEYRASMATHRVPRERAQRQMMPPRNPSIELSASCLDSFSGRPE